MEKEKGAKQAKKEKRSDSNFSDNQIMDIANSIVQEQEAEKFRMKISYILLQKTKK